MNTTVFAPGARVTIKSGVPGNPPFRGFYIGPNVSAVGDVSDGFSVVRVPHNDGRASSLSVIENERLS